MNLLFVCSGNICRSPMAAACMRHCVAHRGLDHVVVDSAGTLGIDGAPASTEAIAALEEVSLDLSPHRSRGLTGEQLGVADLVLVMTRGHAVELARGFSGVGPQPQLLRAFEHGARPDPRAPDLEDPIGRRIATYRRQLKIIIRCVEHLADSIEAQVRGTT